MSISVSEKKIKNKVKLGDKVCAVINIKYPQFESETHEKLCKRINSFYASIAERYDLQAKNRLLKKIKIKLPAVKLPVAVSMNYTVALCDESIISIVLDLAVTEGKNVKMRRFSQMWSVENQDIIRLSDIIETDRKALKKIYSYVFSAAKENSENPAFGYFDDYAVRLKRNFDISCCFAVPKGLCFFVNAGVLAPLKYGTGSFVMTNDSLKGVLKQSFGVQKDEK